MSTPTSEIVERIRALGREILPAVPGSQAVYAGQHEAEPYVGVEVRRDERYGPHERNRLDVFTAPGADVARPIFVFVHGGGFVMGDKHLPGSPYLDNIALWAARHGLVGINITYRLAPESKFPSGAEDVAAAVRWAHQNGKSFGGDPDRIFVMGTSAGAVHVADFIAHDQFAAERAGVKGAILLSGVYDLTLDGGPVSDAYYGEDRSRLKQSSPIDGLVASPIPQLFVLTEFDPEQFQKQALNLVTKWVGRHGIWPDFIRLMGHNHLTSTFHFNTDDDYLGVQVLNFIAKS